MNNNLWAAQFQNISVSEIAKSPFGTVVVDAYDQDGTPFDSAEVKAMGGGSADPRVTLGYMSVGEAGTYRAFWQPAWNTNPPSWLGAENPDWAGDVQVRFWDPAWQKILITYLDGIVRKGFDGVFLDVVDIYQSAMAERERVDPAADMASLVQDLSAYAKRINPDFKIYVNNAEELIADPAYLAAIDGVNKEDLYYGVQGAGVRNTQPMIDWSSGFLKQAQAAGKTVLVTEYVSDAAGISDVIAMSHRDGFLPYIANSDLAQLDYTVANRLSDVTPGTPPIVRTPDVPTPPTPDTDTSDGSKDPLLVKGTNRSDVLEGGDGADRLIGFNGHDVLKGKAGSDTLISGAGRDTAWGGSGADAFTFVKVSDSGATLATRDSIADFDARDRINVSAIDANTLVKGNQTFRMVGEFTGRAGELEFSEVSSTASGTKYLVKADVNGDARSDFSLMVRTVPGLSTLDDWAFIL